ncbi:ThuA domain-containing protein [Kiritimatiella glycovorans]|uniref:ThuA-like domain-containing protein n=1 Tax=Kiritimatiella glycovorans TaxID=1307763 RepID=A0A0G3EKA0_9BACT|nr:ThuA domain-containing protein [Kiritimatiella glycovorans]AKJ65245.1 hypothetical protein L21SP4_02011 [Kiritimatiella glycovorans]
MKTRLIPAILFVLSFALGLAPLEASVNELLPQLASEDLDTRQQARHTLLEEAAHAARPGAEAEREAYCENICAALQQRPPVPAATELVRTLARFGRGESVSTLAALMDHSDRHLREAARQALAVNPSPEADRALREALKEGGDARRVAGLVFAIGCRAEPGTTGVLAPYLRHKDPRVFEAAAKGLARTGTMDALHALLKARKTAGETRRATLTDALFDGAGRMEAAGETRVAARVYTGLYGADEPEHVRAIALLGALRTRPAAMGGEARKALASGPDALRMAVIEAAAQTGDAELISRVGNALDRLAPTLQIQALTALRDEGTAEEAGAVAKLLSTDDEKLRNAAAVTLCAIGGAGHLDRLLALPDGAELNEALMRMDAPGVDAALKRKLEDGTPDERARAITVLAGRRQLDVPALLDYAADGDDAIARAAADALKQAATSKDVSRIAGFMVGTDHASAAQDALRALIAVIDAAHDKNRFAEMLTPLLSDASTPRRKALLFQALMRTGTDAALKPVAEAARSAEAEVREPALKVLHAWPRPNALPVLSEIVTAPYSELRDQVPAVRAMTRLMGRCETGAEKRMAVDAAMKALEAVEREQEKQMLQAALKKLEIPEATLAVEEIEGKRRGRWLDWELSGPYEAGGDEFDTAFAPEKEAGNTQWRPVTDRDMDRANPYMINFMNSMPGHNRAVYLRTVIERDEAGAATLSLGSDDGVKVWLNGELVHEVDVSRACRFGQDEVPLALKKGANELRVKVVQIGGRWSFIARLIGGGDPGPVVETAFAPDGARVKVLLVSGQNNHQWEASLPVLLDILKSGGIFAVDVTLRPQDLEPGDFEPYDVLISHWNGWGPRAKVTDWPGPTQRAYLDFVREGGGHVVVHAGSSSFYDDPEFQKLYGATWKRGQTGHGPVHEFEVRIANPDHPVTRGMEGFTTKDELWHRPGVQPGVTVLTEAYSSKDQRGTGEWEPSAMVNDFGAGRNFVLLLGHNAHPMRNEGFGRLLRRGTEWAATGEVR